jgi:O-antigen ligase
MPENIRALIVILAIAAIVFTFAKKAFGPMLLTKEFNRWRNAWLAITLLVFLAHSFWVFIILSSLFLLYATQAEQNKFALYFALLFAVPTISARIPALFDINYIRLLSLIIILPFFITFRANPGCPSFGKSLSEKLMLAFFILNTLLLLRSTTFTNCLRYGLYSFTDLFLPYYAASRAIRDFEQLKKAMLAFVMACFIVGAIGSFEFNRSWLLYHSLESTLQVDWDMGKYLSRGDNVRALASLGHPIILGYVMMLGLGFYLFIAPFIKNKFLRLAGYGLLLAGLFSPLSRGPWLGAAVLILIFIAFGQKIIRRFALLGLAVVLIIPTLNLIPGGGKVINLIPFVGKIDKDNVEYREKLIDRSVLIVKKYPLFGVPDARNEPEMEDMVQGEGMVDIVNSYLGIVLGMGLVGLSLFVWFFLITLLMLRKSLKKIADINSEYYQCGRSLFAALVAVLVTIFTVSDVGIIPTVYWSLAGLIFSFIRVSNQGKTATDSSFIEKPAYPTYRLKSYA